MCESRELLHFFDDRKNEGPPAMPTARFEPELNR
jgi:hypothetical protein